MKKLSNIKTIAAILFLFSMNYAQAGADLAITQSVVASGGHRSNGAAVSVDGTIGQSLAGGTMSGSALAITSGFWNYDLLTPTAASVSIGGRIFSGKDAPVSNARVTLTGANGQIQTSITNFFGYYRFEEIAAGETYILTVTHKRYNFTPQIVSVTEDLTELNFTAEP